MTIQPVALDSATARLLQYAQGVQLAGLLPDETAKQLVRDARALRAFYGALQHDLAGVVLGKLAELAATRRRDAAVLKQSELVALVALDRQVEAVKRSAPR